MKQKRWISSEKFNVSTVFVRVSLRNAEYREIILGSFPFTHFIIYGQYPKDISVILSFECGLYQFLTVSQVLNRLSDIKLFKN